MVILKRILVKKNGVVRTGFFSFRMEKIVAVGDSNKELSSSIKYPDVFDYRMNIRSSRMPLLHGGSQSSVFQAVRQ